jgi:hypothetical protein
VLDGRKLIHFENLAKQKQKDGTEKERNVPKRGNPGPGTRKYAESDDHQAQREREDINCQKDMKHENLRSNIFFEDAD